VNSFSDVCESGHRVEHGGMRVAHGIAKIALERR